MTGLVGDSLVRRLVLVTLVVGLLTGGLGIWLARNAELRELRRSVSAGTLAAAQRTATAVDGRIDGLTDQLRLLASRPPIAGLAASAETELAVALRVSDDIDELVLYDGFGRPLAAASSVRQLDADAVLRDRDAVADAADGPTVRIVGDELPALELTVVVEDPPGRPVGALRGIAPMQLLTQEAEARLLSTQATGSLVAVDGTIVAHRELDRVLNREVFPIDEAFADLDVVVLEGTEGPNLVARARATRLPAWVVVEQAEHAAVSAVPGSNTSLSLVVLLVVAAIVGSVIIAARRFLAPLGPLAHAVELLGAGERRVRVDDTTGHGEVQVLATGFNRMAQRLQERQEELEEAERTARRSEERLRLMVEGVRDYAIFLLDLDGVIGSWNTGARRLLGAPSEMAKGLPFASFFDPDDPPPEPLAQAAREGEAHIEGWYRRADGERFFAQTSVTALRDEDDEPYGYAVVVHDLTERHAARQAMEAALRREQEAAEDLRRTNALKDEFLAMAAHELQTPLGAITGALAVLKDPTGLPEEEQRHLRVVIDNHTAAMRTIVQRLLDFSRVQAGRVRVAHEEVGLREELEHQVGLLAHELADHHVVIDAPSITVRVDRQALRHIVGNLLSNAGKFSEPGSRIEVCGALEGDQLTIEVRDEGIGIPEEDQDAVFELFRQVRSDVTTSRGTGVGLAIVQRYVELLGGTVELSSAVGHGSTFRVHLPLDPPDA